jgi:polysaccharide chain length determinant protein (PEP-CTERM system associated)
MSGLDDLENRDFLGSERDADGSRRKLPLEHYLLVLLHRKWLVIAVFLAVSVGSAVLAYRLPDIYRAETLILVDPQQVPERYVESSVASDVGNRLGSLPQQILSAAHLQGIIDRFNLYAEERRQQPPEAVINLMRSYIEVNNSLAESENVRAVGPLTIGIAYTGSDPMTVAQVTNELASLFIEENLKTREKMAMGTSQFIESQLEETRKALEGHEAKIRDFRSQHLGEMPDQQSANSQILGQLERQLESINGSLERAGEQKTYLLTLLEENQATALTPTPVPSPEELALPALQARYSEEHPDVQRAKRAIEEQRRAREAAEAQARQEAAGTNPAEAVPTNRTLAAVVQLKTVEDQIVQRTNERARLMEDISVYRARIEAGPLREQQLSDLMRDYQTAKDYYGQLLEKKLNAEAGTELELRQMGEQFSILDPAQVPKSPSGPNRPLYIVLGVLAGLTLGPLLVLASEILGFGITITSPEQLATVGGVALLGVVSVLRTQREQRLWRWTLWGTALGVIVLVLVGALILYRLQLGVL